jgi:hypothetical protein
MEYRQSENVPFDGEIPRDTFPINGVEIHKSGPLIYSGHLREVWTHDHFVSFQISWRPLDRIPGRDGCSR